MTGKGHPLPGSDEARHGEIPEHFAREKGCGDDPAAVIQPGEEAVNPDGEPYRYDDLGRGPSPKLEQMKEKDMAEGNRGDQQGGLPREQKQDGIPASGRQAGGGPSASDRAAPGGSSGSGGYGKAQNQQFHQGQQDRTLSGGRSDRALSRGERFDEQQGGGRDAASVSGEADLQRDQAAHQDRGQRAAETETER